MCKSSGETVLDHLLFHCAVAWELWLLVFSLFEVYWVMPEKVVVLLLCWEGVYGSHKSSSIWYMLSHNVLCGLFGAKETIGLLMGRAFHWEWKTILGNLSNSSFL